MQKPLGMHHIRSKLFSLPLSKLHALNNSYLENNVTNPNLNEYKLTAISHAYTRPIPSKLFNYKHVLRDLNIDDFNSKKKDFWLHLYKFPIHI